MSVKIHPSRSSPSYSLVFALSLALILLCGITEYTIFGILWFVIVSALAAYFQCYLHRPKGFLAAVIGSMLVAALIGYLLVRFGAIPNNPIPTNKRNQMPNSQT
jgi:hypothetical protein